MQHLRNSGLLEVHNNSIFHFYKLYTSQLHNALANKWNKTTITAAQGLKCITLHDRWSLQTAKTLREITLCPGVTKGWVGGGLVFSCNRFANSRGSTVTNPATLTESVEWAAPVHEYWQCPCFIKFQTVYFICVCLCVSVLLWSGWSYICMHLWLPSPIPPLSVSSPCSGVMMKSVAGSPTQYPTPNKLIHH